MNHDLPWFKLTIFWIPFGLVRNGTSKFKVWPHPGDQNCRPVRASMVKILGFVYRDRSNDCTCVFFRDEQRKECFKVRDSNKSLKAGFNWFQRKKIEKIENPNLIMIIRDNLNYELSKNRCTNLIIRFDLSANQKIPRLHLFDFNPNLESNSYSLY